MAQDHLAAPTPLEEHRKLAVFAGEWSGEEMVYPSRWTAGGPATSRVTARASLSSDAVDGVSPAEAGGASDTAISASAAPKQKADLRSFESIEQIHFGRKARKRRSIPAGKAAS